MIAATVTAKSYSRNEALKFLGNKIRSADWSDWNRAGDISLVEQRDNNGGTRWVAKCKLVTTEEGKI